MENIIQEFKTQDETLEQLYENINNCLEDSAIKLLIFIDDIDRLPPDDILDILKLVRLNASFKNTIYFLAYDTQKVQKAIENGWGIDGKEYIKKIIQLDFSLPKINENQLSNLFEHELKYSFAKDHSFSKDILKTIWDDANIKIYFKNYRDIKRFAYSLKFRLSQIEIEDLNLVDFILIEIIRIFDFKSYEIIYNQKYLLTCGEKYNRPILVVNSLTGIESKQQSIKDNIKELFPEEIQRAILYLFYDSREKLTYSFTENKNVDLEEYAKQKRIAHIEYFDRYFTFALPLDYIKEKEIISFFDTYSIMDKKKKLNHFYQKKLLKPYLLRIYQKIEKREIDINFIGLFFDYFDSEEFFLRNDSIGRRDDDALTFLNKIKDSYEEVFLQTVLEKSTSFSRFTYLFEIHRQLKIHIDKNLFEHSAIEGHLIQLPPKLLKEYSTPILEKYPDFASHFTGLILDKPNSYYPFLTKQLLIINSKEEDFPKLLENILQYSNKTIALFKACLLQIQPQNAMKLNKEFIESVDGLVFEEFIGKLSSIELDSYVGPDKEYLELFYNLKKDNFADNIFYSLEGEKTESSFF